MLLDLQMIVAFLVDWIVGDPRWLPHPVQAAGWLALWLEPAGRRLFPSARVAGVMVGIVVIGITGGGTYIFLRGLGSLHVMASWIGGVFVIYSTVAVRDLKVHAGAVYEALADADLPLARRCVGLMVGRDTDRLDEPGISRAAVESVAENTVDGITAPLFYAALAGPVGAMAYRTINTLDSTFGYTNERYREFGWFSARVDDVANYLPARLTTLFIAGAAFLLNLSARGAVWTAWREGGKHPSPNAGLAESAVAGALKVQLGGISYYEGRREFRPILGDADEQLCAEHILDATRLAAVTGILFAIFCGGVHALVRLHV